MRRSAFNLIWGIPWMLMSVLFVELLIFMPLLILGTPVAAVTLLFAPIITVPSRIFPETPRLAFKWAWLDAWVGNWEDGLCPQWWDERCTGSAWSKRIRWFIRNPVTNLRFMPIISTKPDPLGIQWIGIDHQPQDGEAGNYFCWQGVYSGFRWQGTKHGVWFGYKVTPSDRDGVPDYRRFGIGIASQFLSFRS